MKRQVIVNALFFTVTLLATKFILDQSWSRSLFMAVFQTAVMFPLMKWSDKKATDEKGNL